MLLAEDVDALDPQRSSQPSSWGFVRAMHRGLMAFPHAPHPEGSRPVPDLAAGSPEVSADGLRYTFRLRAGVAFGPPASRPVRAEDVRAGLERIFRARSPVADYYRVIAGADDLIAGRAGELAGVSTPDERTVTITLSRPANDLPWLLALPYASAVPPGTAPFAPPAAIPPSGPYRLADGGYRPERSIGLVRNPAWRAGADPIRRAWADEIVVTIGLAPRAVQDEIAAGRADLSGDAAPPAPAAPPPGGHRLVSAPNGCLRYLFMNTRVAPFGALEVRRAAASALDRAAAAAAYDRSATPAAVLLPPTLDGHDADRAVLSADPAAAKRALAVAGMPGGFATRLVVGDTAPERAQAAAVRTALARAGIRVQVQPVPIASVHEDYYEVPASRVPMGIATWCADWPGLGGRGHLSPLVDGRRLAARANTNYASLSFPRLHELLDRAAAEGDPATAARLWREADAVAVRLSAVVPLAHLSEVSLIGARVRGFVPHPFFVRGDLTAVWLVG